VIERCKGSSGDAEIRALFERNGWRHFDRYYPFLRAAGGTSWVARDDAGAVYGHVGVLPRTFRGPATAVRGGVITDVVVDPAHRDFFSAVRLLRRVMEDLQALGICAFAYSDPLPGARAVLAAAGLEPIGVMDRFVLPLVAPYLALWRWLAVGGGPALSVTDAPQAPPPEDAQLVLGLPPAEYVHAVRVEAEYGARLGEGGHWIVCRDGAAPVGTACCGGDEDRGGGTLALRELRWDERRTTVAAVIAAIARWARARGYRKVSTVTLVPSRMARALRRSGCVRRPGGLTLYTRALDGAPPPPDAWLVTALDSSGW